MKGLFSGLLGRIAALAVLFGLELVLITTRLHPGSLDRQGMLTGLIGDWGRTVLESAVAFAALYATFGILTARNAIQQISSELEQAGVSLGLLAGHAGAMLAFAVFSYLLFRPNAPRWPANLVAACWLLAGLSGVALALFAMVPPQLGLALVQRTRRVWLIALAGGVIAARLEEFRRLLWQPIFGLTVDLVTSMLRPLVADLRVDPITGSFSSHNFHVVITPSCAGFEGAGLMLVFAAVWIWLFRKECRFPHALLLVPASIVVVWLLNSVRLAALFLIGNSGAPAVAMGGFHSEAGWIAFSGVALGFSITLQRFPGLTKTHLRAPVVEHHTAENATAWYLAPFLVILSAAMVGRAASDGFEWLYPLRFFAAAAILWNYRHKYTNLDWRISWAAPLVGSIVFVMWLGLELLTSTPSAATLGTNLAALQPAARVTWILFRAAAASLTVPIAEELAFRGYLLRRVASPDFERVDFRRFSFLPLLVSSIAFGLMHGNRWLAGTLAGVLYALALRHRGRIGDAVAAHAITNALLAAFVLLTGNYQLW